MTYFELARIAGLLIICVMTCVIILFRRNAAYSLACNLKFGVNFTI